ncbi:cupin-like domain-containing protein [Alkalimonas sp. MEB108]|uniref:Cupin-like domain-containing protein n=1 Tax=Alkalimonas cellulosilytica TaxID=3058395 RepID=A0ABU7J5S5_9GAMM|nr:cupin-like domain-containing protein [Alkalimonas sp. MEB108]MEE2001869.1 cupin-like domain-containing protein [Alkalimonas sp. MEB108]
MPVTIPYWEQITPQQFFADIQPLNQPAVLKGLVGDWPAVQAAKHSTGEFAHYLQAFDNGQLVTTLLLAAQTNGRIFYQPQFNGFNYERRQYPVSAILAQLMRSAGQESAVRIAAQSALVDDCLPGFASENGNPLLPASVQARIWLGNQVTVPAHFDDADNLACVVAGKRRFTLFPPEQVGNLYIGPLDYAPTGTPISLVDFTNPDWQRFPKAEAAWEVAQVAELDPGDVLFIPAMWWHQVESCADLSVLCNYWWNGSIGTADSRASPFEALLFTMLQLRQLPAAQRTAWQSVFSHYLSAEMNDFNYLPADKLGVLGSDDCPSEQAINRWLMQQLQQRCEALKSKR